MCVDVVDVKNTIVRLFIIVFIVLLSIVMSAYFWVFGMIEKHRLALDYVHVAYDNVEATIRTQIEKEYAQMFGEAQGILESLEWEKQRYEKLNEKNKPIGVNANLPIDTSFNKRNSIVFIEQKGANGATAYDYSYYEILNENVIIGRANFQRQFAGSTNKMDSMNRMKGVIDTWVTSGITVYKQLEIPLDIVPEMYKLPIRLGTLKVDTLLSLAKQWGYQSAPLRYEEGESEVKGEVDSDGAAPIELLLE